MLTTNPYPLLQSVQLPADLRQLHREQLGHLATELRAFLLESVAKTGGHLGSNLGTVELTVALHYVFITPHDRVVWAGSRSAAKVSLMPLAPPTPVPPFLPLWAWRWLPNSKAKSATPWR